MGSLRRVLGGIQHADHTMYEFIIWQSDGSSMSGDACSDRHAVECSIYHENDCSFVLRRAADVIGPHRQAWVGSRSIFFMRG